MLDVIHNWACVVLEFMTWVLCLEFVSWSWFGCSIVVSITLLMLLKFWTMHLSYFLKTYLITWNVGGFSCFFRFVRLLFKDKQSSKLRRVDKCQIMVKLCMKMALISLIIWIHESKPQLMCKYCVDWSFATHFVCMFALEEFWTKKKKKK